jgi:hypothetical protein
MSKSIISSKEFSLNGEWQLVFDPENIGKKRQWDRRLPGPFHPIPVPGVIELVRPNYDGVVWYQTAFSTRPEWKAGHVYLRLGAVQYYSEFWLNQQYVGAHEGGSSAFELDVTRHLRPGVNTLVVRVINPPMDREIEGFRCGAPLNQSNIPSGKAGWYFNFGGIWQDVSLKHYPAVAIHDIQVIPFPGKKEAVCHLTVRNDTKNSAFTLDASVVPWKGTQPHGRKETVLRLKPGLNRIKVTISLSPCRLWSPDDPFLYTAQFQLRDKTTEWDSASARFGMREFTIRGEEFILNGKPIILKGFLHQGMYPRTIVFPETAEMVRREFTLLKENGFNFLRAHLRPPPPVFLDLADEMGILLLCEPPIGWIINSPETAERCRREVEEMLLRDRNHPSIVIWCLLNEAFHFQGFSISQVIELTTRLAIRARELDPTRLLIDTSGGYSMYDPNKAGGTRKKKKPVCDGMAVIMLPHTERRIGFIDDHAYCKIPASDIALERYRAPRQRGRLLFFSEYGSTDTPPQFRKVIEKYSAADRRLGLEDYQLHRDFLATLQEHFNKAGLKQIFGSLEKFIERAGQSRANDTRLMTSHLRLRPAIGGYCYTQFADASGELFGVLDVWRNPKPLFKAITEASQTPLLVPVTKSRVVATGASVPVDYHLINEHQRGNHYDWTARVQSGAASGALVAKGKVRASSPLQKLSGPTFTAPQKPGAFQIRATLKLGQRTLAEENLQMLAVAPQGIVPKRIALYDPRSILRPYLGPKGVVTPDFTNNFREKGIPILFDQRQTPVPRQLVKEIYGQLKKIVQLGGCAILLEPDNLLLYEDLFPTLLRPLPFMYINSYVKKHPLLDGLPSDEVAGYAYAEVDPHCYDRADDVQAAGGQIIFGGFSMHNWSHPAEYTWGAGLYVVPLGRGHVIVCHLRLLDCLDRTPLAQRLLANLLNHAATLIRPGGAEKLLSRCIDPLPSNVSVKMKR